MILLIIILLTMTASAVICAPSRDILTDIAMRVLADYEQIPDEKFIIYQPISGFGDTLKGSSSVFYLALATGRRLRSKFYTDAVQPIVRTISTFDDTDCQFENFFSLLDDDYDNFDAAWSRIYLSAEQRCWRAEMNGEAAYDILRRFGGINRYPYLEHLESQELFWIYTYLFWHSAGDRISEYSRAAIPNLSPTNITYAVQMRVTENKTPPIRALHCFYDRVVEACADIEVCRVYITSDLFDVTYALNIMLALHRPAIQPYYSEAPVVHIAKATTEMQRFAAIYDWWILSNAQNLLISRSGFGETAGWRNRFNVQTFTALDTDNHICTWTDCHLKPQKRSGWNYC